MLSKTRITLTALLASAGFAVSSVAPAVSQAQWHTICTAGHCTTHSNYTIGGTAPCSVIGSGYGKAYEALLDAIQARKELPDKVHPEMTPAEAQASVEAAEAQVHLAEVSAYEWGCAIAMHGWSTKGARTGTLAARAVKAAKV